MFTIIKRLFCKHTYIEVCRKTISVYTVCDPDSPEITTRCKFKVRFRCTKCGNIKRRHKTY